MRGVLFVTMCLLLAITSAAAQQTIPLWPNGAPGEKGDVGPETVTTPPGGRMVADRTVKRITNVTVPTITVYRPSPERNTGVGVLVSPGGGYNSLSWDNEGTEACEWLNSVGVTAILLKYRVPKRAGLAQHEAPLQDAQRALGLVRLHSREWGIDPSRIGVLGFSAGGHLSAVLSNNYERRSYAPVDAADGQSCRPDFVVLVYPAYLALADARGALPPELPVSKATPPTFIVQTEDDASYIESTLSYHLALKRAAVPAELHVFPTGGHGYGLRPTADAVTGWPKLVEAWMRSSGILHK